MEIKIIPIQDLKQAEYNPRSIDPEDFGQLKRSLEKFGFVEPLVVNSAPGRENVVIGGNQRLKVASELGWKETPVHYVNIPKLEDEKELNIRLNRNLGEFDFEALKLNFDMKKLLDWGFEKIEFEKNLKFLEGEPELSPVPNVPKELRSRRGEIYILGRHRLMCGDSSNAGNVSTLMNGEKARLFSTDPPWGVDYAKTKDGIPRSGYATQLKDWGNIENDNLKDEKLQLFLESVFKAFLPYLDHAAWYLWHAHLTQGFFSAAAAAAAAAAADVLLHRQIIWKKPHMVLTRSGMYHWQHEPCFYGWRRGEIPAWYGDKSQTTIWEIPQELNDRVHQTQKPTMIFEIPIKNHLLENEICSEPFAGSGSQIIAAEKLGRRCFAMEIDPKYCDVIIKRYCNFTNANEEEIYMNAEKISCPTPGVTTAS